MEKVKIERLDDFGRGIGKINGKIIFVENALPEEVIECEIIEEKKNYLVGKLVKIIEKLSNRVNPPCKYYNICGGCNLQHLCYKDTIKYKEQKIKYILEKENLYNGKINVIENKNDFNYRNKIELKIENYKLGFYQSKTHNIVEIDECLITKESINKVITDLKKINIKDATITIRCNYNDEILLIINSKGKIDFNELIKKHKIVGIILNNKLIYNDNHFVEVINDMYFKVTYNSFFQVNEYICSKLFEIVNGNIKENSIVADLYCGVGTLSLVAAKKAKKVYGIEIVENAIIDATKNAKINNIDNAYFMVGKVEDNLSKINDKLDTIIVDPPRAGLDKKTIEIIKKYKPRDIIYISCNPRTLIRDLKELKEYYDIVNFYILDMFSYTHHVECVSLLCLKETEKSL